jgi:hypothetical protein
MTSPRFISLNRKMLDVNSCDNTDIVEKEKASLVERAKTTKEIKNDQVAIPARIPPALFVCRHSKDPNQFYA